MPTVVSEFAPLRDPRLAAQLADRATSPSPAWLWSSDGSRILWANAVGAAIFGGATRRFDARDAAAAQIVRLAATLPSSGPARLERLRGFGAGFGRALTCACSRIALADGRAAVLVVATEAAGPPLTLKERVSGLFPDRNGTLAAFAPDGALLFATRAALTRLAGATTLSALGIEVIARQALAAGSAGGATRHGPVTVERLGSDASTVLVVTFGPQPSEVQGKVEAPPLAPRAEPVLAAAAPPTPPSPRTPAHDEPMAERRHPLRFVWQMDADGRFVVGSDEFMELMGPRTTAAFGRLWSEIAAELKLDPDHQVVRAVATRETWSGIVISWPVDELRERLPVELSGLPVFDRDRNFRGYRGFGVCRDIDRINQLARARRERPIGFIAQPEAPPAGEGTPASPPQSAALADTQAAAVSSPAAPAAANVVPFRQATPSEPKAPSLSPVERRAFRELAQELTARLWGTRETPAAENGAGGLPVEEQAIAAAAAEAQPASPDAEVAPPAVSEGALAANAPAGEVGAQHQAAEDAQRQAPPAFEPVLLDRIPVGVLIYRNDSLLYGNRHFLELSGYESLDGLARAGGLNTLFAEPGAGALAESGGAQSLSIMTPAGARVPVQGRLFTVPWSGASALALVIISSEAEETQGKTALVLGAAEDEIRELKATIEPFKKIEEELRAAKREAQKAAAAKAEFLAKVSHEMRTPLNTITGFAEVIMAERFGPVGNERYREYLKDIHVAGTHLVSLLNDLLDLSKIETGQLNLTFANVSLNDLTQQCVGIMQPQASRARIIIRTSLTPELPQVVADERSLRQIVLNLLSNSIRFTGPGGQVIVSTAFADSGEAVLRVRDTGIGMSDKDVEAALEPFRQTATSGSWGSGGIGLGLPLTKALAEANRAHFSIRSAPNAGTLVEVAFPPTRIVAQ